MNLASDRFWLEVRRKYPQENAISKFYRTVTAAETEALVVPEAPYIGTGVEARAARDAGDVVLAEGEGTVGEVSGAQIVVEYENAHFAGAVEAVWFLRPRTWGRVAI